MWWDHQNLDKSHTDKTGKKWNFRVWHESFTVSRIVSAARVFFWDETKSVAGVVLLGPNANYHVRDIHALIRRLAVSEELRARHRREIRFPLERFYADYGIFPEEQQELSKLSSRA